MADGISDILLGEFILKERNYLDGVINEDELVNLDFLNVINANDELLITSEDTGTIQPIHEDLEGMSDFKRHIWISTKKIQKSVDRFPGVNKH